MNLFLNAEEGRFRAGWRILAINGAIIFLVVITTAFLPFHNLLRPFYALILIFGVIYYFGRKIDGRSSEAYGLTFGKSFFREFRLGFGLAIGVMAVMFLITLFFGLIQIEDQLYKTGDLRFWGNHFYYLLFMIAVGFYEELWNRGYLLLNLSEGFSGKVFDEKTENEGFTPRNFIPKYGLNATIGAVLLSSIFFSVLHLGNPNVTLTASINIALAGIMLALPFVLTGKLHFAAGLHAGWNYAQGGIFGWSVSGTNAKGKLLELNQDPAFDWLHGGAFGPEGGLLGTAGIVVIIAIVALTQRR